MDCKKISRFIPLFIDNIVSSEIRNEIQEHLLICKECKRYAEAIHNQKKQIKRAFQSITVPEYLPDNVSLMIKKNQSRRFIDAMKSWRSIIIAAAIIIIAISVFLLINQKGAFAPLKFSYHYETPELSRISGKIVCIGCELRRIYGLPISCSQGHKLVLKTKEGNYFNYQVANYIKELKGNNISGCDVEVVGYIYKRERFVNIIAVNWVNR